MILLLGATGYIGQAFQRNLQDRKWDYKSLSRGELDYTRFDRLYEYLKSRKPEFLVNCAGYTGKPNVDACELAKADTLLGNTLLPQTIANACAALGIPWGHVSSGCIFAGGKVTQNGQMRVEKDFTQPHIRELIEKSPGSITGFNETDTPNFSFRDQPCSFYSGTKALGEEAIAGVSQSYIWRLRIPFDEFDNSRNYLSKVQRYAKAYDNANSISHRADFAWACLELWARRAPYGVYNVTNPGFITTRQVIGMIERVLKPARKFEFWADDVEFYKSGVKAPRSNCIMDTTKLLAAGVKMRPVLEALEDSLKHWQPEKPE